MRGKGGVAAEGRIVNVPKFYFWGKCTMALTNINSCWMSNASSGLCIVLVILFVLSCILGCRDLRGSFQWGVISCLVNLHFGV